MQRLSREKWAAEASPAAEGRAVGIQAFILRSLRPRHT